MLAKLFSMGRIVVSHDDCVIVDADVTLECLKDILGQMGSIPLIVRRSESLTELMNGGLSNQGHGHLAVTDIEV